MLILGIDPGTATTGYGVIRSSAGGVELLGFGLIETDKDGSTGKRLVKIHKEMRELLRRVSPDSIAIERLFFAANARTAMSVGQAVGVMLFSAAQAEIEIFEYAPSTVKKAITGNGRADKKQMQKSLRKILGSRVRSGAKKRTHFDNAADALAVALCHAYSKNGSSVGKKPEGGDK